MLVTFQINSDFFVHSASYWKIAQNTSIYIPKQKKLQLLKFYINLNDFQKSVSMETVGL